MINIPNYEIGKLAGRGGVAEVYLARHKLLDRTVAIKLICPTQADELTDKRFLKEARVVAGLRHPNIVSIYDVGVYENKYYIIMEYLEGGDLKQNIKRGLTIPQTLKIMRQIASALAHAHDKGFIHRDIKSQNIMFRADGTAVLTDFGIVKDLTAETGYTLDGTSIGTPHYMSPEQAQGTTKIDWRTDLYSLGVTFYEMLTGSVPYNADSAIAVALKHIKDPIPQLPEKFSQFQPTIDRLMAKNPKDRFQSAHELVSAIGVLDGEGPFTDAFHMPHALGSRVRLANIFSGVLIGCVIGGVLFASMPLLEKLRGSGQTAAPPSRTAAGEPMPSAEPDSKKSFLDMIKNTDETSPDTARLTDLIVKHNYPQALDYILKMRKDLPESSHEMMKKADQALRSGQYLNAGDMYNSILSVDGKNTAALLGLLYVAVENQRTLAGDQTPTISEYDALLALLDKGIKKTESQYFKHLQIAAVESIYEFANDLLAQNRFNDAKTWADTGLKYAPDHLRLKRLGFLIQARDSFHENRLIEPDQDNALSYYRLILQLDPEDAAAKQGIAEIIERYQSMALAARKEQNFTEALALTKKARSIAPENRALEIAEWQMLGDISAAKGQITTPENENARYYYQKILTQDPENQQAILGITKTDVLLPLYQVRQAGPLPKKIPAYQTLFSSLETAISRYGQTDMADVKEEVIRQIKSDILARKNQKQAIPSEFMALVSKHFPEEKEIFTTQYDIFIASGDESAATTEKAEYYLKALKLNPGAGDARRRIEKLASSLGDSGKTEDARTVLNQAMTLAPDYPAFGDLLKALQQAQDIRAEIFTLLLKIKKTSDFAEKTDLYAAVFSKLTAAAKRHGAPKISDAKRDVIAQIHSDISALKNTGQLIPETFMTLVRENFPEKYTDMRTAQYDMLMENGDRSADKQEKATHFLKALALDNTRPEAKSRIEQLANNMDQNGNNPAASDLLGGALEIAPNELIFTELSGKIKRDVEIFATRSGCGRENQITQAPVSIETLNLCIAYRNMAPESVVNVVMLNSNTGHRLEVPVVLEDRSGSKPIDIAAPIEGFAVGDYSISVTQNETILSEILIQFLPKRRE
ncbi:MAG: hypothetical protein COX19_10730 [Desulfobacterales bacterium CG23_combo_of_CG06-09_8_20_14_all_51_8]|nr:MAG: hypothetical protein COX19_10730 [Desulfobacterales bacterium CG23_combo_of_CG06-09_8_20_14_all_51_8]